MKLSNLMKKVILLLAVVGLFTSFDALAQKKKKKPAPKKPATTQITQVETPTAPPAPKVDPGDIRPKVGQANPNIKVVDGGFERRSAAAKGAIDLPQLRESDIIWSKVVYRQIDLKEKQNLPLAYKGNQQKKDFRLQLMDLMKSGKLEGFIFGRLFADYAVELDDSQVMSKNNVLSQVNIKEVIPVDEDGDGTAESSKDTLIPIDADKITALRVKEEWYFDKQYGRFDVRIVAIAPCYRNPSGDGYITIAWVYYPALRPFISTTEMICWQNDNAKITFDDFFIKRLFSSVIYREVEVGDRNIEQYTGPGTAALKEADKIKNKIIDWEQSLWEY
jgi:gliding motility associated protien GldN